MRPLTSAAAVTVLKGAAAVLQLLILVATAQWFGVAFRGEIALFTVAVNMIIIVVGFTGGPAIIYLSARDPSRAALRRLLALSYGFGVVIPVALALLAAGLLPAPGPVRAWLVVVAVMNTLSVVHVYVLFTGRAVWQASWVEFLRPFCLLALAAAVAFGAGFREPRDFFIVWAGAAALAFALSVPLVAGHYRGLPPTGSGPPPTAWRLARDLLGRGSIAQASNLVQLLNYRALFFAIERHAGLAVVGLFSTAVALAEVLWIPASGMAAVTLNRVSRAGNDPATRGFVLRMARVALVVSAGAALAVVWTPAGWIPALLGREFAAVRPLLVALLPVVAIAGVGLIAGADNAGRGAFATNLAAALAGLVPTGLGFFLLAPRFGADGALVAMIASYLATNAWLLAGLRRRERVRLHEIVPRAADFRVSSPGGS